MAQQLVEAPFKKQGRRMVGDDDEEEEEKKKERERGERRICTAYCSI
jgi:hypothetical protein